MNRTLILIFASLFMMPAFADEGMWLPQLLGKLNESRMKSLGMKISAADIYSINNGSLKDAIVSFGGFCTGEVISDKGLVLTNHHCGFDAVQNHSSLQNNYIRDGFWAKDLKSELQNAGLFVTFIVRIDDVTAKVMKGVNKNMTEPERQSQIDKKIAELRKSVKKESYQESFVRGFFEANQYYLFVTETYRDVRLVGAPPSSIGNYGVDTDNWMWPRHTGDFSMFRIYAGKDNKPAEYSPENVPFVPKRSLKISLDGVAENDFTMVFGFPGRTTQYLTASAVEQIRAVSDPLKISIRDKALGVMNEYMRADEGIKIKYASKYARVSNAWKKWQGEVLGLTSKNINAQKMAYEAAFQKRVDANPTWKYDYGHLLPELDRLIKAQEPYGIARDYYNEVFSKIELYNISTNLLSLQTAYNRDGENGYARRLPVVQNNIQDILKDFDLSVDKSLAGELLSLYYNNQQGQFRSLEMSKWLETTDESFPAFINKLYSQKNVYLADSLNALLALPSTEVLQAIKKMDAVTLFADVQSTNQKNVNPVLNSLQDSINRLQRTYMQAQMEVFKEKTFYPDANSTLRVTYGQVKPYSPRDGVKFNYYTTLDGVMEKYKPGDYEFDLPAKLIELHAKKDYGRYAMKNGEMPVCFIGSNHTTGGNSGSPAVDAYGNLIGLNFDRVWEGTMSDIAYNPDICRNIMVDIRYVLFIVDKFAGAQNLIDEMKFVHPKKTPAKPLKK